MEKQEAKSESESEKTDRCRSSGLWNEMSRVKTDIEWGGDSDMVTNNITVPSHQHHIGKKLKLFSVASVFFAVCLMVYGLHEVVKSKANGALFVNPSPTNVKSTRLLIVQSDPVVRETGSIIMFAGRIPPDGWLFCDGSVLDLRTNPELIPLGKILSSTFSADIGLIRLPDLRGRVPVGSKPDLVLGTQFGSAEHLININELPSHLHTGVTQLESQDHTHLETTSANFRNGGTGIRTTWNGDGYGALAYPMGISTYGTSNKHTHNFQTNAVGGGSAFSLHQPSLSINYIIKI